LKKIINIVLKITWTILFYNKITYYRMERVENGIKNKRFFVNVTREEKL